MTRAAGCLGLHPVSSHPRAPRSESRNCPEQPGRWTGRRGHCGDWAGAAWGSWPAPPRSPAHPPPRSSGRRCGEVFPGSPAPPASWSSASEWPRSSGVPGPPSSVPRKPRPLRRPCWDEASTRGDAGRAQADPPVSVRAPSGSLQRKRWDVGVPAPLAYRWGTLSADAQRGLGAPVESSRPSPPDGSGPWAECT